MLNTFTSKLKSLFTPQAENTRKRKRPLDESNDSDCEIIEVKRAKSSENPQPQIGYNFFAKMADWVRNKTSWDKMFDFKVKDTSQRNGQSDDMIQIEHSGNGLFGQPKNEGQHVNSRGQPVIKGHRKGQNKGMNSKSYAVAGSSSDGCLLNGDQRDVPPDNPDVKKKTYASIVKGTAEEPRSQNLRMEAGTMNGFIGDADSQSIQRTLFPPKKQEIHFTANETIRLDERERYKMLLQKYTQVPLKSPTEESSPQDSWPSLHKSRPQKFEESILSNEARKFVSKINVSQTAGVTRQKVTPNHIQQTSGISMLHRHISPIDVIKSSSFNVGTVQSPTSIPQRPLLESTRFPDTSMLQDTTQLELLKEPEPKPVIPPAADSSLSQRIASRKVTNLEDYRKCRYLTENWKSDLLTAYSSSAKERQRKIEEAEKRAQILEEMRKGKDDEISRRIELQMRLSEREPVVTEDLPVEEEEEEEVLPDLTPEMDDVINRALRGHPPGEVLVEGYRLQITRADVATLAGLNWLNDEVINFYMNMLMERGEKDNFPKCYAFNTFFYPKIMSAGHSSVRRWTKKVDIFSYDYIIIPVHLGMHWCLCIVDFKKKMIRYYDSMGGQNVKCLNAVKQYLCDECKDKKNKPFDLTGWSTEIAEDIPQQMNGSDCGMFACKFAEYITREAKISFEQKHMPYFRRRMVYEIVKKKLLQ